MSQDKKPQEGNKPTPAEATNAKADTIASLAAKAKEGEDSKKKIAEMKTATMNAAYGQVESYEKKYGAIVAAHAEFLPRLSNPANFGGAEQVQQFYKDFKISISIPAEIGGKVVLVKEEINADTLSDVFPECAEAFDTMVRAFVLARQHTARIQRENLNNIAYGTKPSEARLMKAFADSNATLEGLDYL